MADPGKNSNALGTGNGIVPVVKSATYLGNNNTNTVVAAVDGKCIAVLALTMSPANSTVTLMALNDGSTAKWRSVGACSITAPTGGYLFKGTVNTVLNCTVTGAANAYISVSYVEEDA